MTTLDPTKLAEELLLPCPWCGILDGFEHSSMHGPVAVACAECGATGPEMDDEPDAIAAWNNRFDTPEREIAALREAAQALIDEGPTLFRTATWHKLAEALAAQDAPSADTMPETLTKLDILPGDRWSAQPTTAVEPGESEDVPSAPPREASDARDRFWYEIGFSTCWADARNRGDLPVGELSRRIEGCWQHRHETYEGDLDADAALAAQDAPSAPPSDDGRRP